MGITDYFAIDGYKKVLEYEAQGRLKGFEFIFPNIELRTHPETSDGRAINLHLLIDPSDSDHVQEIERALRQLTFTYNNVPYACDRDGLERLGRAHDPQQTDAGGAYRHGIKNFKPSFENLRDWYQKQGWLQKNSLIVLANGKDGASGLSKDAGFAAARDELYRFSDMIFSGLESDRRYFLGQGTDDAEEVRRKAAALMPCVHGSDAHDAAKLFEPDLQRYCWIKADPTFEGLRQLLHEPEDRVFIGPTPPAPIDASKIIDKIVFRDGAVWFQVDALELNPGFVGIIGEKGSGKTALAELIAYGCSAWKSEGSSSSFIKNAGRTIEGITVEIHWADGRTSVRKVGATSGAGLPEARYLSQDFVEELCSRDLTGNRLITQIEEVIFSYIDESDQLGASSFEGLRRLKTEHLSTRKTETIERLTALNREIIDLENQFASRAAKVLQLAECDTSIAAIDAQLPSLQGTVDAAVAAEITRLSELLQSKSTELATLNRLGSRIGTVRERATDYARRLIDEFATLEPLLREIGFGDQEIEAFRPTISMDRDAPFDRRLQETQQQAAALRGDPDNVSDTGETIADLQARLEQLRQRLATDQQQRERLLALQAQKTKLETEKARITKEIERLDGTVCNALATKRETRWATYLAYFDLLSTERDTLAELYSPLSQVIADDPTGDKSGFELNVRQRIDAESWMKTGRDLFDMRRANPLASQTLGAELEATLFEGWRTGDQAAIRGGLENLLAAFGDLPSGIDQALVSHATRERVYDWLFSTDHVRLNYGLKYRGTDLEVLSPGTRGIVLLVLYLAMDRHDPRPLIIDQPEGNLDNSSIYEALVPFLRKAKKARQVILVTHNPNLVVTTDADQVIVARAVRPEGSNHPLISYTSGALEDAGTEQAIRDQAVKLLEGGPKPFKMREHRYSLPS